MEAPYTFRKKLLITKLVTTNIGNQALSDEIIKLFDADAVNLSVVGRPSGLVGYSLEKLAKSPDPTRFFENWADALLRNLNGDRGYARFTSGSSRVTLLPTTNFKVKNDAIFQTIKLIFRRFIHSDWLFSRTYRERFRQIRSTDVVIYNGAGEVRDNNIFLRQLLELRLAQKMGKRTFAINQSVEVFDEAMSKICGLVYGNVDRIVVRGKTSKRNLISLGVQEDKIFCYPDAAFLNAAPSKLLRENQSSKYGLKLPAVGLNATDVLNDIPSWKRVVDKLRELRYHVYFISNDPFADKTIAESFASKLGVTTLLDSIDYHTYSALLGNFDFVISCRLHTNELALTAGIPVIPIEGSFFKTSEVFSLVEYPIEVVQHSERGWPAKVIAHIESFHRGTSPVIRFFEHLDTVRKLSLQNRLAIDEFLQVSSVEQA